MGRAKRRQISIALGLVMLMGIGVYFRLWTIDYCVSSNDTELLRRQFDLANREAMDESAEWRRRYDWEFEKAAECSRQLDEIKRSAGETKGVSAVLHREMEMLQKENVDLLERVESLKQELEAEKLKCSVRNLRLCPLFPDLSYFDEALWMFSQKMDYESYVTDDNNQPKINCSSVPFTNSSQKCLDVPSLDKAVLSDDNRVLIGLVRNPRGGFKMRLIMLLLLTAQSSFDGCWCDKDLRLQAGSIICISSLRVGWIREHSSVVIIRLLRRLERAERDECIVRLTYCKTLSIMWPFGCSWTRLRGPDSRWLHLSPTSAISPGIDACGCEEVLALQAWWVLRALDRREITAPVVHRLMTSVGLTHWLALRFNGRLSGRCLFCVRRPDEDLSGVVAFTHERFSLAFLLNVSTDGTDEADSARRTGDKRVEDLYICGLSSSIVRADRWPDLCCSQLMTGRLLVECGGISPSLVLEILSYWMCDSYDRVTGVLAISPAVTRAKMAGSVLLLVSGRRSQLSDLFSAKSNARCERVGSGSAAESVLRSVASRCALPRKCGRGGGPTQCYSAISFSPCTMSRSHTCRICIDFVLTLSYMSSSWSSCRPQAAYDEVASKSVGASY
ncbi:UNVERIFIED_CONTAM: hypothetical protein Scaly_1734200 [Sesamum calycinum]|uniref:Uncharacterized protein n=2 Tax=Sesamum TaxID=4181 RepID=A0AAW2NUD0_9LAMI